MGYFVCVDWLISHRRFFFDWKEGYGWIDDDGDDDDMFIHQRDSVKPKSVVIKYILFSPNKHT